MNFKKTIISKLRKLFKSSHIQIAIATGTSILLIAIFSKFVLEKPINSFLLTIPPLIEVAYEYLEQKGNQNKLNKTWYWVVAILFSTALIILSSWILE